MQQLIKKLYGQWLEKYSKYGKSDAIQFIYAVPKICMPNFVDNYGGIDTENVYISAVPNNSRGFRGSRSYTFNQNTIDGYTPKNNKVLCYPYNVIELTNNKGDTAIYKPELFSTFGTCNFEILSNMLGNVSLACFPSNYEKVYTDTDEGYYSADSGISLVNFPQCSWSSDFYKNWLAQNSYGNNIQVGLDMASGIGSMGLGYATGNPVGVLAGGGNATSSLANYLANDYKARVTPNQARGNSSNINSLVAHGLLGFYINHKNIKYEHAKIIDDYFTMFGYKVNKLATPNLRSRTNWNYIETKNINITGAIPNEHLEVIQKMFDNGVTLWHNDNVGNYNRNNPNRE